jgi:hypothetical protein
LTKLWIRKCASFSTDLIDEAEDGAGGGDDDGEREGKADGEDECVVGVDRRGNGPRDGAVAGVVGAGGPGVLPGGGTAAVQQRTVQSRYYRAVVVYQTTYISQ